jgi:hypothetical protein
MGEGMMDLQRLSSSVTPRAIEAHPWLKRLHVTFLPEPLTPIQTEVSAELRRAFIALGHSVQPTPDDDTNVLFTFARFGEPVSWRQTPFLQARRMFRLQRQPAVVTIIHARTQSWDDLLEQLATAISKEPPDPRDFEYAGLAPSAYRTLVEQGRRGGPVLAAERLLQAQAICIRILLIVGNESPERVYHFDLVGSLAYSEGSAAGLYEDIVQRVTTAVSAEEIGAYSVRPDTISADAWRALATPAAMRRASLELDTRSFFTETVRVHDLVHMPAVSGAIANQYSEGCFATWEPALNALISTITGSARPVDKGNITDDELAVVTGVHEDRCGVDVRHVVGKRNDPPSSEAFEMVDIDRALPWILIPRDFGVEQSVPVVRSKLHGHRGVAAYRASRVEFAAMEPIYSQYPVTCGTLGQAEGVKAAFARSEALRNPLDQRQLVFTLLPTHGLFIVEKWVPGKAPFQAIWEAMDAGDIVIDARVPQGPEPFSPVALDG